MWPGERDENIMMRQLRGIKDEHFPRIAESKSHET